MVRVEKVRCVICKKEYHKRTKEGGFIIPRKSAFRIRNKVSTTCSGHCSKKNILIKNNQKKYETKRKAV